MIVSTDIAKINLAFRVGKASKTEMFGLNHGKSADWNNIFITKNIIMALEADEDCGYTYLSEAQRDCLEQKVGVTRLNCNSTVTPPIINSCIDPFTYLLQRANESSVGTLEERVIALLDRGVVTENTGLYCCPDCGVYVLCSVNTFLKYIEGVGDIPVSCTLNVTASVETYLVYAESIQQYVTDDHRTNPQSTSCVESYSTEEVMDAGVVELGTINNSTLVCIVGQNGLLTPTFLDAGIVVECKNGEIIIASVNTYLKYLEAITLGGTPS